MMKKLGKVLFLSLIAIVLMFFGASSVDAASKAKNITIKNSKKISTFIENYDQDFKIYKTKSKKTVYGLEFDKKTLKNGKKLTFDKNADAGLLYILEHGYPKTKITGDSAIDKYITQAAIWWYLDETGQGSSVNPILKNGKNKEDIYGLVSNYIKPLVEEAKYAKGYDYVAQQATINLYGNNTLSLSKNRKYFETDYITVDLVGASKYTVSSNATVLDENGDKRKKFNASEMFKVRIPISKISDDNKISVTVKATGKENVAKIYTSDNDKYQSVVGLFFKNRSLTEKMEFSVMSSTNCKYVDGDFHDKTGKIIDEQTYKQECSSSCKIINENYYGADGEETSKLIYDGQCGNSCATDGNVFYGIDSRKVNEDTFNKECKSLGIVKNITNNNSKKVSAKEKAAKAKAEKEKAEKAAKAKAEKEKVEKAAKAKAEKEKAEKAAKAKAEKEKAENTTNNEGALEVDVPNTKADVSPSKVLFGSLFVLMGLGILIKRIKF